MAATDRAQPSVALVEMLSCSLHKLGETLFHELLLIQVLAEDQSSQKCIYFLTHVK